MIIAIKVLLFLLLFSSFYFLNKHADDNKILSRQLEEISFKLTVDADSREKLLQEQVRLHGEMDNSKLDLLTRLDRLVAESGIKRTFPFMSGETVIVAVIVMMAIGIIVGQAINKFVLGIVVGFALSCLVLIALNLMRNRNYRRIESTVTEFINLMDNFSRTTDDIISIIGKTYPYLNEPLRSLAQTCYVEGMQTGNIQMAMGNFERNVPHRMLREIIHNITVCSRHDANYAQVIQDSRKMLMEYLKGKEERRQIVNNGRLEFMVIATLGGGMAFMMNGFMDGVDIIEVLLETTVGNVFLGIFVGVVILATIDLFIKENGKD